MRLSAGLALAALLAACAAPVSTPPTRCTSSPERIEVGAELALSLRIDAPSSSDQLRLVLPHPWYGLRSSPPGEVTVRGVVDGRPVAGQWLELEHGHSHAVLDDASGSGLELHLEGLRAPSTPGDFEPVVLWGGSSRPAQICPGLSISTFAGPTAGLDVTAPTTAGPGEPISLGLLFADRLGNPAQPAPVSPEIHWERVAGQQERVAVPVAAPPLGSSARWEVPGPSPGLWVAEVHAGSWVGRSNALLVADDAPREFWADLHGHGALSDGWRGPKAWLEHARDVAFLDAASLSEHSWQLSPEEWAELVAATDGAQVPGRFATLPAMEVNVVGHEVAYLRDPSLLAGAGVGEGATTIWQETDLGQKSAALSPAPRDWVRDEHVLVVPHTSLHGAMGSDLPSARLGRLSLIEVYSAHGSSMERGGWRAVETSRWEPGTSVLELLERGERLGFLAAGDSHDGRPGTTAWGGWPGGLTALRLSKLDRPGLWEALQERATVATSGRRVHADARLQGKPVGSSSGPGSLRYRVGDVAAPQQVLLYRDGRMERSLPRPVPGSWAETTVEGDFRSLHLEVVLHDGERAWLSPWFGSGG